MIKCLCKENVQDKFTGEYYVAGNEYEFTEERAAEVTNSRYFEYAKVEGITFTVDDVDGYKEGAIEKVVNEIIEEHNEQVKPKRGRKSANK